MNLNNINAIANHNFVGNAYHDAAAFEEISLFVCNEDNSIADRAEALRVMSDRGMGMGRYEEISDEVLVREFIDDSN